MALTEIHYPHSWNNIQGNFQNRFYLRNQEQEGIWDSMIIPPGHYCSIQEFLEKMNELARVTSNMQTFTNKSTFISIPQLVQIKLLNNITNRPLLENTCKDDFCEDAGTFSKDDHLPLSNLQTEFEDVFAFSAKVHPVWEGVSRWMWEARLSRASLVQSLVFEQWVFVLVLEQPSFVRSLALELDSL